MARVSLSLTTVDIFYFLSSFSLFFSSIIFFSSISINGAAIPSSTQNNADVIKGVLAANNVSVYAYNKTLVQNTTKLLDSILKKYDKTFRPPDVTGGPTLVMVDIEVRSVGPISEKDMEFSMDCYFRQTWKDERLKYEGGQDHLALSANFLRTIWRPDTYIRNGKKSYLHTLTVPNIMVRISRDGTVKVSQRLTIKTLCPMDLRKFPMDSQACKVDISSMAYSAVDLVYRWKGVPQLRKEIESSQYAMGGVVATQQEIVSYRTDELVSTLYVFFKLHRQQGYYLLQIYTPCMLTVVMSWVSFWINKEASPARVALGVMTVLTMSTMALGGRNELPRVSYSTALDTYIVGSFAFVFLALVEYAVINFAHFVSLKKAVDQIRTAMMANPRESSAPMQSTTAAFGVEETEDARTRSSRLEHTSIVGPEPSLSNVYMLKRRRVHNAAPGLHCCQRQGQEQSDVEEDGCRRRKCDSTNNNYYRKQNGGFSPLALDEERKRVKTNGGLGRCCYERMCKRRRRKKQIDPETAVDWIDTLAKILFPAAYLIFNWLYWMAFFYWLKDDFSNIQEIKNTSLHVRDSGPPQPALNASI